MAPNRAEHVAGVERREGTERAHAEPAEQVDEVGVDVAELAQPADGERRDELGRTAGRDDEHTLAAPRTASRAAIADADARRRPRPRTGSPPALGSPIGTPRASPHAVTAATIRSATPWSPP